MIFWIIGGVWIAVTLIILAILRVGGDSDSDNNPYNGDRW